jgi:hypothetical protein
VGVGFKPGVALIAAPLRTSEKFVGIGLIFALAVGSQILAAKLGIPRIIVLLPVGFVARSQITSVNPTPALPARTHCAPEQCSCLTHHLTIWGKR